ncbi:hypothetical protein RFF55_001226 [Klebsiella pneumoniae]|uniref:hypothetical protein n=1 Tax=Klebsiella TaxID=570 RepID=UPI0014829DBD|nr:hypothetical protein [Klebsiella pneumoniae]ELA1589857.1 hypothetical protein [Klebsiella pneumoniae]HCI8242676.1 hypothetical protein [Klebsiella pneumoniae]
MICFIKDIAPPSAECYGNRSPAEHGNRSPAEHGDRAGPMERKVRALLLIS